jgi:hypothetical protein
MHVLAAAQAECLLAQLRTLGFLSARRCAVENWVESDAPAAAEFRHAAVEHGRLHRRPPRYDMAEALRLYTLHTSPHAKLRSLLLLSADGRLNVGLFELWAAVTRRCPPGMETTTWAGGGGPQMPGMLKFAKLLSE